MALCVEVGTGLQAGLIKKSTQAIDDCTNYVILHSTEYQSLPMLTDIFTTPVAADLQQMWMLGFATPLIAYLTAWGYGVVINWFNDRKGH
jgi:hypothetical protein